MSSTCAKFRPVSTKAGILPWYIEEMEEKLTKAFAPERLEVIDESHLHAGHAGARPGGETHFRVYIVSDAFRGKSRLERHRILQLSSDMEPVTGLLGRRRFQQARSNRSIARRWSFSRQLAMANCLRRD